MKCAAVYGYSSVKRRWQSCRVEIQGVRGLWPESLRSLSPTDEPGPLPGVTRYTCPVVFGSGKDAMQACKSASHAVLHQCSQRAREYKRASCDLIKMVRSFTHPNFVPNLYDLPSAEGKRRRYFEEWKSKGSIVVLESTDFHGIFENIF